MLAFIDETWIKTGAVGSETGRKYGGAMTRSDEIELKLVLNREDARLLETSHLLTGDRTTQRQRSIYFDTPDHRLARAGLTLRIRRAGGRRIQTVKARDAGSAGLFVRPEWERAVPDDRPVIDDTTPLRALLDKSVADLAPLFEIHVERRAWSIREDAAIIDVVIDRGMAVTADRQSPFCEMELELKGGDATALFAFARKLDAAIPVRLGTLTKAERGYALIDAAVTAFKAEPVVLDHDMCICLPGASARWLAQSKYAPASAAGEMPLVRCASCATVNRSTSAAVWSNGSGSCSVGDDSEIML